MGEKVKDYFSCKVVCAQCGEVWIEATEEQALEGLRGHLCPVKTDEDIYSQILRLEKWFAGKMDS